MIGLQYPSPAGGYAREGNQDGMVCMYENMSMSGGRIGRDMVVCLLAGLLAGVLSRAECSWCFVCTRKQEEGAECALNQFSGNGRSIAKKENIRQWTVENQFPISQSPSVEHVSIDATTSQVEELSYI